ncbi:hypothetical protein ACN38_g13009 [Penicillium nordicum]|uniref:Uncharacterized protein n=1 Tax=Penicillium nordicum TaxID=229535 RepID=A0A0M8NWB8_9EURO|nr:hypothetical protein ACN38_g13009 [Penicillium nordicum]
MRPRQLPITANNSQGLCLGASLTDLEGGIGVFYPHISYKLIKKTLQAIKAIKCCDVPPRDVGRHARIDHRYYLDT